MKLRLLSFGILMALLPVSQACAPVYIPTARHAHQLDHNGELSGAVLMGTNGVDAQAAFAVSDHVGIAGAGSFGDNAEGTEDYHEHSYGELAIEYFSPIGKIGRFELLGGGGSGSATSVDKYGFTGTSKEVQATGKYNKLFLQSNIGLETNAIEMGVALRLGHVMFTEFETSSNTYDEFDAGTFFEPALYARLGWENIKIEGQVGTTGLLQDEEDIIFDYRPALVSVGLHFNLSTLP